MQFRDLQKQYQHLKPQIDTAVLGVMNNAHFISGKEVKLLEEQLAEYVGVPYCVSCANGTDALSLILTAWNVGVGDAVFVPDFTFFATAEVISYCGATPVFVDVLSSTFNMDPSSLELAIQAVLEEGLLIPKVIIPVDLFGLTANYTEIEKIATLYGLKVLEDGAQGFGGTLNNKKACSFGDAATTSFFPAKPLGCYGDGGAIFVHDEVTRDLLDSLRVHGKGSFKYDNVRIGVNSRLDTIQAAILIQKLQAFKESELGNINIVASWYNEELKDSCVTSPVVPKESISSWAQYTIQLKDEEMRNKVQLALKEHDIPSMIYYPKALHKQTAFTGLTLYTNCPVTEKLCNTVLSLPIHPYLEREEVNMICKIIKGCE